MATEKIFIQIDNERIELKGAEKDAFIADQEERQANSLLLEAQNEAKKQARIDAITKLGQATGLNAQEIEAILNI